MKKVAVVLVCCMAQLAVIREARAEVERLEANVAPAETGGGYTCVATLTRIPSHEKVVVESLEAKAGEKSQEVWGSRDSEGNGHEYRLTCTVNESGTAADVELRTTRLEAGRVTSFTQFTSKVSIR